MELSKYPLDRLFYFVAAIIPGAVAFMIFQSVNPGSFGWFFQLGFLGYRTRVGLILVACFIVGYTMTIILNSLLGAFGGAIGGVVVARRSNPQNREIAAPWRDPRWRALVKSQLKENAPRDSQLIWNAIYDLRLKIAENLPERERQAAILSLNQEKLDAEIDDSHWEQWYDHYHQAILQPKKRDFVWHVQNGLNFNLQTTSLYVLISAFLVPGVRHWWLIVPASMWLLILVSEIYSGLLKFVNRWSTLSDQCIYLANLSRDDGHSEN